MVLCIQTNTVLTIKLGNPFLHCIISKQRLSLLAGAGRSVRADLVPLPTLPVGLELLDHELLEVGGRHRGEELAEVDRLEDGDPLAGQGRVVDGLAGGVLGLGQEVSHARGRAVRRREVQDLATSSLDQPGK